MLTSATPALPTFSLPTARRACESWHASWPPGGTAFIIDNDLENGSFAGWLHRHPAWKDTDPAQVEQFWSQHGFTRTRVASEWRFQTRAALEAVVRLEFGDSLARLED